MIGRVFSGRMFLVLLIVESFTEMQWFPLSSQLRWSWSMLLIYFLTVAWYILNSRLQMFFKKYVMLYYNYYAMLCIPIYRVFACSLNFTLSFKIHMLFQNVWQVGTRRCWRSPSSIGTTWRAASDVIREFLFATPFGMLMWFSYERLRMSKTNGSPNGAMDWYDSHL